MSTPHEPRGSRESFGTAVVRWSVENPYPVLAFYIAVTLLAVLIIGWVIPRRMMPYVQSPMVGVISMMPGLSAEEMEIYISKPIEEQMANVPNLHYVRSTSQDGLSVVSLEFEYGVDMKKALFDVQSLMNVVQSNLPATGANLKPSWVLPIDPLNLPVLSLALTNPSWDPVKLREFADNEVVNRLKVLPDVQSIVPFGGYRRQLQIIVDRAKLASYGLSILDVKRAVDSMNVSRPAGAVTYGPSETIVRVDTRALDPRQVLEYPISATGASPAAKGPSGGGMSAGGMGSKSAAPTPATPSADRQGQSYQAYNRVVLLKDVARVEDTHWERRSGFHYVHDGTVEPAIEVSVIQNPWASSAKVVPRVSAILRQMERDFPGVKFQVAYDNAHFVSILFRNMFEELALAILLTGIAIFLFLGNWRATVVALITIPTSMSMAVMTLIPMGMTLNSGTLIGLLLSIGRLVDDSIIDIHSIQRHLKMGKDVKTAAIDGISEVRMPVLAATFTLCLALAPLLFSGGIVQLMFVELVWPIILALLASMVVSFTHTALLSSHLLRPQAEMDRERDLWIHKHVSIPFERMLDRLDHAYGRALRWTIGHRFPVLVGVLCTIIVGFGFYPFIGSEMMPLADVGQAYGALEMHPGTSYARTEQAVYAVEKIMLKHPEIRKVATEIGSESMLESWSPYFTGYAMPQVNGASMMITLSDKDERKRTIWDIIDSVQKEAIATVPGIRRLQIKEMGSDVMASSLAPIALIIYGKDLDILDDLGRQLLAISAKTPGMYQPAVSWAMEKPEYEIRLDLKRAREMGLTPEDVALQAYYSLKGGFADEFYRLPNLRQNTVLVRYEHDDRRSAADLEKLSISTPDGRQIPLSNVASLEERKAPTLIEHDGMRRVVTVTGYYRIGGPPSMDLGMDIMMRAMEKMNFPPGYGLEMRGDMTQMMDSFRRLLFGLGLAIFFIYLILVAQFRGFMQPLQMILSLPLELTGVFLALWLTHQSFSTVSIMSVIVLTGMDITTAVLLVDKIVHYREQGMPREEAVVTACPQRLRPIMMTSLITIIAMTPVAFFPRTGMDAYQSVGTVVIGGLLVGTFLSLFLIPVMHLYVDDLGILMGKLVRRRKAKEER